MIKSLKQFSKENKKKKTSWLGHVSELMSPKAPKSWIVFQIPKLTRVINIILTHPYYNPLSTIITIMDLTLRTRKCN